MSRSMESMILMSLLLIIFMMRQYYSDIIIVSISFTHTMKSLHHVCTLVRFSLYESFLTC